ncbi:MAG: Bax inhibitor-1 family protein [Deltaproteobacteria bacterium]|nr:Bax inhibitor-1 family protein [Deltaproteobacteria bacterium]
MAFAQSARPIEGAVATLGVSDRVAFLRRTYAHLGVALVGWAAMTVGIFRFATNFSLKFSEFALRGQWNWLMVIGAFMLVQMGAQALSRSEASKGYQYAGLTLAVVAESIILQPLIWIIFARFANGELSADPRTIVMEAGIATLAIFTGLTLTVFVTKKDFSFLRGALMIASFAALGIIVGSAIFGFHLGIIFVGAMIVLMAGYILMQTSMVMKSYPPTAHVAAALMLFSTVATLFWYVLQFVMEMNRR